MKSIVCALGVLALASAMLAAQSADVQKVLDEIKAKDKGLLAVSEEDGRFLRLMVASKKAQHALEIGGASGYSAIWIGMGLRDTGGRLVTIEYDPDTSERAGRQHQARRALRHRPGDGGGCVSADPEGAGDVRLRVPRCVEEGLQAILRHGLSAGSTRAACSSRTMS